jgi:hypothetical protein
VSTDLAPKYLSAPDACNGSGAKNTYARACVHSGAKSRGGRLEQEAYAGGNLSFLFFVSETVLKCTQGWLLQIRFRLGKSLSTPRIEHEERGEEGRAKSLRCEILGAQMGKKMIEKRDTENAQKEATGIRVKAM